MIKTEKKEKEFLDKWYNWFKYLTFRMNCLINLYNENYEKSEFQEEILIKIKDLQDYISSISKLEV